VLRSSELDLKSWRDSDSTIVEALVTGSTDYDEISEEFAKANFPNAFAL
jgi:hypothetical protein